jgi:glycosyltransferase involved in cell wall biosynthesis
VLKNLLYIGNKLAGHGLNQTTMETLGPLLEREGFAVTYASSKKNQWIRMLDMLWSVCRNRKTDYVIIDTYSTVSFWYAFTTSQLCRLFRLKYIPFLHGGNLPNRLQNNPGICRMIFKHAHINVAPSHYLLEAFKKQGFSKIIYIPNAIETNKYPFKERKIGSPKLLWVRSFAEIYNPIMAVSVFQQIKEKYPESSLCMVGPDKDGSLLKTKKVANGLGLQIIFTGKLSKEEWMTLSQEYDIFINTTHFDNMPVSVIEAMSLGLAVVSTNVGGIPFLLEHDKDALLVADDATDEMVASIRKLMENPALYQELTTQARRKALAFDWESVKDKWIKILR